MEPIKSVTVFYFELPAIGRGEIVRLYFEAIGLPFEDERLGFDDWKSSVKLAVAQDGRNPAAHLPITTIDGKIYTEHISTVRYVARRLGFYGKDAEVDYFTDAVADSYQEWRNSWANSFDNPELLPAHKAKTDTFAAIFETFLTRYEGPFFAGQNFTFADAAVFQIIHDEIKTNNWSINETKFPLLSKFYTAVQKLPKVAEYLASPRRHE